MANWQNLQQQLRAVILFAKEGALRPSEQRIKSEFVFAPNMLYILRFAPIEWLSDLFAAAIYPDVQEILGRPNFQATNLLSIPCRPISDYNQREIYCDHITKLLDMSLYLGRGTRVVGGVGARIKEYALVKRISRLTNTEYHSLPLRTAVELDSIMHIRLLAKFDPSYAPVTVVLL